jgi:hypothetical protein
VLLNLLSAITSAIISTILLADRGQFLGLRNFSVFGGNEPRSILGKKLVEGFLLQESWCELFFKEPPCILRVSTYAFP